MESISMFHKLANLFSVGEIYQPFLHSFDHIDSIGDVFWEWTEECEQLGQNPMEEIALVTEDGKGMGIIEWYMLNGEDDRSVYELMYAIELTEILSFDSTIYDVIKAFANRPRYFFLILRGDQFIGWINAEHLNKFFLNICLYGMLINLERLLLLVIQQSSKESLLVLPEGRKAKARQEYIRREYNCKEETGEFFETKLLECTTFVDKFTITRRSKKVSSQVIALNDKYCCEKTEKEKYYYIAAEKIRNLIAHPGSTPVSNHLPSYMWWPFI